MEMQTELLGKNLVFNREAVTSASFLEEDPIYLMVRASERLPRHFHRAVRWDLGPRGRGLFSKRGAESPATEGVPMRQLSEPLEPHELISSLLREDDAFDRHPSLTYQKYPGTALVP